MNTELVWNEIVKCEGEEFFTKNGQPFSYNVSGEILKLSNTDRNIPKSNFETALTRLPLSKITQLKDLQGPSHIYGILTDQRISVLY